jgi:sugar phosphate isomerase/epimerase
MDLVGKTSPDQEELEFLAEFFDGTEVDEIEVFLDRETLEEGSTISNLMESDFDVASVHIPHISPEGDYRNDWEDYLDRAAGIANFYDSPLVFHSQFMQLAHKTNSWYGDGQTVEDIAADLPCEVLYENNPETGAKAIDRFVKKRGDGLALDTAHLYCGCGDPYTERDAYDVMQDLLADEELDIGLIHLTDAITGEEGPRDGVSFEKGDSDLENMVYLIEESDYDGKVVMEVDPLSDEQHRLYRKVQNYLSLQEEDPEPAIQDEREDYSDTERSIVSTD